MYNINYGLIKRQYKFSRYKGFTGLNKRRFELYALVYEPVAEEESYKIKTLAYHNIEINQTVVKTPVPFKREK